MPSSSVATTTTRMPAIAALAAFVPCADAGIRQTSRFASPRSRWYARIARSPASSPCDPAFGWSDTAGVPGDRAQPALEVGEQLPVPGGLVERGERVDLSELGPRDRHHLGRRVELHRARPERDHRAVEREVQVREPAQVPQHLGLGLVPVEHRVLEDRAGAGQLRRDHPSTTAFGAGSRCQSTGKSHRNVAREPERVEDGADLLRRRRLVERDPERVRVDQPQVDAAFAGRSRDVLRPPGHAHRDRVEVLLGEHLDAPGVERGCQRPGEAVDPRRRSPAARRDRGTARRARRSPRAGPARCRCCSSPSPAGCAARGSAGRAAAPAAPCCPPRRRRAGPAACACARRGTARNAACGPP